MLTNLLSISSFQSGTAITAIKVFIPSSRSSILHPSISSIFHFVRNNGVRSISTSFVSSSPDSTSGSSSSWMDKNKRYENRIDDYNYELPMKEKGSNNMAAKKKGSSNRNESAKASPSSSFREEFRSTRVFVQNIPLAASWQDVCSLCTVFVFVPIVFIPIF